jgi:phage host-nuclease inhibitor protein Gam
MPRKRTDGLGLTSWQEVDANLLEIGRLEREIEAIEAHYQKVIELAKTHMVEGVKPLQERRRLLALQMEHFCLAHQEEMAGRSRKLNFGTVSFRKATSVVLRATVRGVVEALKRLGLTDCIRVKEEPDKIRLGHLDGETLAQVGAAKVEKDIFGYEVDRQKVQGAA